MKLQGWVSHQISPSRFSELAVMARDAPSSACVTDSPHSLSCFLPYLFTASMLVTSPRISPASTATHTSLRPHTASLPTSGLSLLLWPLHSWGTHLLSKSLSSGYLAQECFSQTSIDIIQSRTKISASSKANNTKNYIIKMQTRKGIYF